MSSPRSMVLVLIALCACRAGAPGAPTGREPVRTDHVGEPELVELMIARFAQDPTGAIEELYRIVPDPQLRDFILLTATLESGGRQDWCQRIRDEVLLVQCRSYVTRPHLHEWDAKRPERHPEPEAGG